MAQNLRSRESLTTIRRKTSGRVEAQTFAKLGTALETGATEAGFDGISATIYKTGESAAVRTENRSERVEPLDAAFINNIMITSKAAFDGDERRGKGDFPRFPVDERRFLAFLLVLTTTMRRRRRLRRASLKSLKNETAARKSKRGRLTGRRRKKRRRKNASNAVYKRVFELFEI